MLIAGVMLQVRVGLEPLFQLRREVAAVRTGKTDRVAGDYPAELAPLASELNALVAHNQDVVERQRTHVGNLAHALKTPLSVMAAEARPGPDRWPRWSAGRPTSCASRSITICAAPAPPPGRRAAANAPRWRR